MALAPDSRFGRYRIVAAIGAGGMGEVYRATDTSLERDVAIKVLSDDHRLDAEASMRLEREAKLLAALNHPNIATLHGLESSGDVQALVMELVEGESLEDRIARAPHGLPVAEAVEIAAQIATALDAAHQQGVIHRDLKPANVKIRPDGTVKVLDFGIAKVYSQGSNAVRVNTVTQLPGTIVGTPSYMSPEQATGGDVDRRADIWAFGCVLFELLTGQRVFDGDTSSRILARVLERDPDWGALPPDLPPAIRMLLRQCLEKNVRRRRRDAGDLRLDLELAAAAAPGEVSAGLRRGHGTAWLATSTTVALLAIATTLWLLLSTEAPPESHSDLDTPPTSRPYEVAMSPDGRYVVHIAVASPESIRESLYLRDIDTGEEVVIPGTEGARLPCWSPDSQSIAFFSDEYLRRVDISGGAPRRLAPALNGGGCSWGANGEILFTPSAVTSLYKVPASGEGPHVPVTEIDLNRALDDPAAETNHRLPSFVDGTDLFLYQVTGGPAVQGIHLGSIDEIPVTRLIAVQSNGVFVAPHWVVYLENDRVVANRLDIEQRRLTGEIVVIADSITRFSFSASRDGSRYIYRDMAPQGGTLTLFDRNGSVLQVGSQINGPEISSDDRLLAFDNGSPLNRDIYTAPADRSRFGDRQSGDATVEGYPDFSPDDTRLSYERQHPDNKFFELWQMDIGLPESARLFRSEASAERNLIPLDWSVNDYIVYRDSDVDFLDSDLLALPAADGDAEPVEIAVSAFEERLAQVSPSGDWIAFDSNQPGQFGVFVQPFPDAGVGRRYPATSNGFAPRWNGDDEIVYLTLDGQIMAAAVAYTEDGVEIGRPVELFRAWIGGPGFNHSYTVTGAGHFLINVSEIDQNPSPITLVQSSRIFGGRYR